MYPTKTDMSWIFKIVIGTVLIFSGVLSASTAAYGATIGEVVVAKGKVISRSDTRATTDLTKGAAIYEGDILETVGRSFLVVQFNDGGKIILRPDSQFNIEEYDDTPGQEKEKFKLVKGGLRAVTGAIGKNRPENVTYTASNTTMGIRGTTFVITLCDRSTDACAKSDESSTKLSEAEKAALKEIALIDKSTGEKEEVVERIELRDIVEGLFVQVEEGGIRVNVGDKFFDLQAGGACSVAGGGGVDCFFQGLDLANFDVFVSIEPDVTVDDSGEQDKEDEPDNLDGKNTETESNLGVSTVRGAGGSPTN